VAPTLAPRRNVYQTDLLDDLLDGRHARAAADNLDGVQLIDRDAALAEALHNGRLNARQ
jgi:hypothetical protein